MSIIVESGNSVYDSRDNCNAIVETATNTLLFVCKNTTIPNSVTTIGDYAFSGCDGLTSIEIPNSVTTIGCGAFFYCDGLTSVSMGNSVTTIGDRAFYFCSGLTSIKIPNSVTTIGYEAFRDCYCLTSIEIPNSVTTIGYGAFRFCSSFTSVSIGNSVATIGDRAFERCSGLTSIKIPNSVTTIGDNAFCHCDGLTSIIVESGNSVYDSRDNCNAIVETATNSLLSGCKNTTIPNSVTTIGGYAFYWCSGLTSIEIPNSVTTIGKYAFGGCSGLKSIEIPNSVTTIGNYAFESCRGLESVTSLNTIPPSAKYNTFSYVPSECELNVPAESVEAYRVAEGWSQFTNFKTLPVGVEDVDADAVTVRGENGVIRIDGAEGAAVEVYNAAGVCVYSGEATEVPVPQRGIYVVKVAGRATKLAL